MAKSRCEINYSNPSKIWTPQHPDILASFYPTKFWISLTYPGKIMYRLIYVEKSTWASVQNYQTKNMFIDYPLNMACLWPPWFLFTCTVFWWQPVNCHLIFLSSTLVSAWQRTFVHHVMAVHLAVKIWVCFWLYCVRLLYMY